VVRVRFAPSPTGPLHAGGARTALYNYVFAKQNSGTFVLRIDDTDQARSQKEFELDIYKAMRWLGLQWDEGPDVGGAYGPYRQSERFDLYRQAAQKLLDNGAAFKDDDGSIRLRYYESKIQINDLVCGESLFTAKSLGPEPVLVRADAVPTYHLASVVDDIEMKITHVFRGQDHLTNTAKHILLTKALGAELPQFAHLPLILGEDGTKLSKRNSGGLVTVNDFRDTGYVAEALVNLLMLLGWSHPEAKEQVDMQEAIASFSLDRVRQAAAIFEMQRLKFLGGWWIRHLDNADIAQRALDFCGEYRELVDKKGVEAWTTAIASVKESFVTLSEAGNLCEILFALELDLTADAKNFLAEADTKAVAADILGKWRSLLTETQLEGDQDHFSAEQFSQLMSQLKKHYTGPKKLLFQLIRIAIMGHVSGPELKILVPLISRDALISRADSLLQKV